MGPTRGKEAVSSDDGNRIPPDRVGRLTTLASVPGLRISSREGFLMAILYAPVAALSLRRVRKTDTSWSALIDGHHTAHLAHPRVPGETHEQHSAGLDEGYRTVGCRPSPGGRGIRSGCQAFRLGREDLGQTMRNGRPRWQRSDERRFVDKATASAADLDHDRLLWTVHGRAETDLVGCAVFGSLSVFDVIAAHMYKRELPRYRLPSLPRFSIGRMNHFLRSTEMLDEYKDEDRHRFENLPSRTRSTSRMPECSWNSPASRPLRTGT